MCKRVLIIGNGFDLQHGLKTQYNDFIRSIIDVFEGEIENIPDEYINAVNLYKENAWVTFFIRKYKLKEVTDLWIDLEKDIKSMINKIILFVDSENKRRYLAGGWRQKYKYDNNNIEIGTKALIGYLPFLFDFDLDSECYFINEKYISTWNDIDKNKIIEKLNNDLFGFEELLKIYLYIVIPITKNDKEYKCYRQISTIKPDSIITFNYTHTGEELYGFSEDNTVYVHGNILSNIVLGYDDNSNTDSNEILFNKFYRRIIKKTNMFSYNDLYTSDELGGWEGYDLYLWGHSLSESDRDILHSLISNSRNATIFFIDDKDYNKKIYNLIVLLGKEEVLDKLNSRIKFSLIDNE